VADCTNVVSEKRVSRAKASIVASSMSSASCTTASWLPVRGIDVKTSSHVTGRRTRLLVEVEVAGRALLEPQAVVVGRLLEELGRLLEQVLASGRGRGRCGGRLVGDRRRLVGRRRW